MAIFPHPAGELHVYIKASSEVLKKAQSKFLSDEKSFINEKELSRQIRDRIKEAKASWPGRVKAVVDRGTLNSGHASATKEARLLSDAPNNSFNPTPQ